MCVHADATARAVAAGALRTARRDAELSEQNDAGRDAH